MRKSVAIIMAGIMAISLAACGKSSSPAGDSTGNAGKADTGETKTVNITVQSWQYALGNYKGYSNDDDLTKAIAEAFNSSHPGISANVKIMRQEDHYNSLKVDFASGDAPDVIAVAPGADLEQYKSQLEPLNDYASKAWGDDWTNKFTEASLSTIKLSGDGIYALPSAMSASGTIWYNNKMLQENGVQSLPQTWEDLAKDSQTLRKAGKIPLMFGGKDNWQNYDMFITIMGTINKDLCNDIFTLNGDWKSSDVVKAFDYYQKLFKDGIVQDGAISTTLYNEGYSQWRDDNGKSTIPMIFNGSWDLGSLKPDNAFYKEYSSNDIKVSTMPSIEGKAGVVLTAPDVAWGVNANSSNKEAAWEFVKWLCYDMQQDVVNGLGFFSVLKDAPQITVDVADDYKAAYDTISKAVASDNTVGYRNSFYTKLNDALFDQLQLLGTGTITPEAAAKAMAEAAAGITK
ncbi:ABC-type glycerol-3-phosphate transport system, substrate-binding protein [Anaerocolumna jejuensis DSM 15929]|uniref:ABC-type glycerol-3-phosphate transport system, substrate-binding protein n=1 Tax=Anaerocolumna jejuensis DSM 15929 TaxID=1121322 RepID=A0A1M7BJE3_9FIRM|nr:extracellular solute-binding protein [Anaerocolumna jejuensis]SHL55064.1 ABC-type glycerol-3-phosphate transport system, substrate-binding protein [Anaerocolumna jejuensis DSM 15929]